MMAKRMKAKWKRTSRSASRPYRTYFKSDGSTSGARDWVVQRRYSSSDETFVISFIKMEISLEYVAILYANGVHMAIKSKCAIAKITVCQMDLMESYFC